MDNIYMDNIYLYSSNNSSYQYINQTKQIQIVRLQIGINKYIEKAIFPDTYFDFTAPSDAYLEINTYSNVTSIVSDRFLCQKLKSVEKPVMYAASTLQI
jgi:hypothetical protein